MMQDTEGRWFSFVATSETLFCLEKGGLADHLAQLPSVETPVPISALLRELEDAGEASSKNTIIQYTILISQGTIYQLLLIVWGTLLQVKIKISHHILSSNNELSSEKALAFILDNPKPEKKGKKKGKDTGPTQKNFGSRMNALTIKTSKKIEIGWRVRFLSEQASNI